MALSAGDIAFLPVGRGHGLADNPSMPLADEPVRPVVRFAAAATAKVTPQPGVETVCGAYWLDPRRTHPLLNDLPAVAVVRSGKYPTLDATVGLLAGELAFRRPGGDAAVASLLDLALVQLMRTCLDDTNANRGLPTGGWAAALADPVVAAALQAIHARPAHPWTVEGLGRQAGASRTVFAERFARLVGQPPLRYVTWWRMTRAGRLLESPDGPDSPTTVAAVARQVGYRSEFAFAKAFKRHYGIAPGNYRAQRSSPTHPPAAAAPPFGPTGKNS